MIPRFSGLDGKNIEDVSYEEIVNHFSADALTGLLEDGGKGLKRAIANAVGAAASKAEAESKPIIAERPVVLTIGRLTI